jgi:pilus assembly protein Flp/PilA
LNSLLAIKSGAKCGVPRISKIKLINKRGNGEDRVRKLFVKIRQFLTSEDGPTAVEYAVMLALIVVVCLATIRTVGANAKTAFTTIANSLASGS